MHNNTGYSREKNGFKLVRLTGLKCRDIVSIVGAGGKTTLMYAIAAGFKEKKVLITTSTKIALPKAGMYDFFHPGDLKGACMSEKPGVYVAGAFINDENKLCGFTAGELDSAASYFDLVLIESDGAKEKRMKACAEYEPVIADKTTKTIAVLSLSTIGLPLGEKIVHRADIFTRLSGCALGDIITKEHIKNLLEHEHGLFKNSAGEKILYINMADNNTEIEKILDFAAIIDKDRYDRIVYGSLTGGKFYELEK